MKQETVIKMLKDKPADEDLGTWFVKSIYIRPSNIETGKQCWAEREEPESMVEVLNKYKDKIRDVVIIYTPSIEFDYKAQKNTEEELHHFNAIIVFTERLEEAVESEILTALYNEEQWNDVFAAGVNETIIHYCESY